jgi:hypothetical protein
MILSATRLSATGGYVGGALRQLRTLAIVGGSTIDYNQVHSTTVSYFSGQGFAVWACAKLRQRLMLAYNTAENRYEFGTFGFTNAQILATHIPQVVAAAPDIALLYCGINNVGNLGQSGSTVWDGISPMVTTLLAAGIIPVVMLIGPRDSTAAFGAGYFARQVATNDAIKAGCDALGVMYFDPNPYWQDPATGEPLPGVFIDGVHPSNYGSSLLGDPLADWFLANFNLGPSPFDSARVTSLLGFNPTFTGGTTIATGWTSTGSFGGTRVYSKITAADGGNNWQQLNHTGATRATHYAGVYTSGGPLALPAGLAPGDLVRIWGEMEVDTPNPGWIYSIRCNFNGTGLREVAAIEGLTGADAGASYNVKVPPAGVYASPVIQVPANATTYSIFAQTQGGGITRWRNVGLEKVTSYAPPAIGS